MIQWLIDHYAEIAVYSGMVSGAIGLAAAIALGVIKYKEKKEWKEYINNAKRK